MTNYGKVSSTVRPDPIVIDKYSVWVNTEIEEISEDEFVGYQYNQKQYDKDEFIRNLGNEITDTQLALTEIYEMMVK